MAARDDSVIRGSLIASLIFLVLSLALNVFLWQWGDTQSETASNASDRLSTAEASIRQLTDQTDLMKSMLGARSITEAEFSRLAESVQEDADMATLLAQRQRDMAYFGQEIDPQNRNYRELPQFFVNALRERNEGLTSARQEVISIGKQRDSDLESARTAQKSAEDDRDAKDRELQSESAKFVEEREQMVIFTEQTKDRLNQTVDEFTKFRKQKEAETNNLKRDSDLLANTVNNLKQENNRLRADVFESAQGEVKYVVNGGNVVTINLGSADSLRPGVTFGVIDANETRINDANVKATIQVTRVPGEHIAEARVVARPEIRDPIIRGDKIWSPFWAPGWKVKIALAGNIDIDGDGRPDNEAIKGMIRAAGAEVAAEVGPDGTVRGELDGSVRFLVVGETPEVDREDTGRDNPEAIQRIGRFKELANQLGVTLIPDWKLLSYLKTIDDSLTTPLGSASSADDFPPDSIRPSRGAIRNNVSDIYLKQTEGMQQGNEILRP